VIDEEVERLRPDDITAWGKQTRSRPETRYDGLIWDNAAP